MSQLLMIAKIENRKQLIENAETPLLRKARQIALQTLEHALSAANPKNLLKAKVRLDNSNLHAGIHSFNLKKFRKIYVVGGGKAGGAMAEAIEEVNGDAMMQQADTLVQIASDIVETVTETVKH